MVLAKKYIISQHFKNEPKPSDLTLVEEELPPVADGEVLVEAEYFSVDPYMRPYSVQLPLKSTMIGSQIAKIIESKNSEWPVGKNVLGYFGWRTHTIFNPTTVDSGLVRQKPIIIPDLGDLPPSLALGSLGMPGNTAYFGFLEICKPKPGETLVVSGAAGAVGSHVGQLAKIHGLKVIGITGSEIKGKWLINELGFDHVINYKTENITEALKKAAPKGIDCYFDNVGGDIASQVIYLMNPSGRVSVCGCISAYNNDFNDLPKSTILQPAMVFNQLRIEGFLVSRWADKYEEAVKENMKWIREGKLKYRETITNGFENIFKAFAGMLKGENIGKAIVKA